jgi:hypothetical protein
VLDAKTVVADTVGEYASSNRDGSTIASGGTWYEEPEPPPPPPPPPVPHQLKPQTSDTYEKEEAEKPKKQRWVKQRKWVWRRS